MSGLDPDQVRAIAYKVAQEIGSAPGAENVNYNWMEPARTVRIRVDQDQARLLGLSSQQLALSLNAVVSGVTATQMRSGIYLVDVLVRASAEQRMALSTIRTLQVPLPNGRTVPLSQIASVDYDQEYPIVWRRDRRPTVTVQADVAPGTQAATVVQALVPKIAALNATLPSGYRIDAGGTVEESSRAQNSVVAVLPMMLILILTVLMIQLQSFNRLFLQLRRTPELSALPIPDAPTRSCRNATLAAHAEDGDRAAHIGDRLRLAINRREVTAPLGAKSDRTLAASTAWIAAVSAASDKAPIGPRRRGGGGGVRWR